MQRHCVHCAVVDHADLLSTHCSKTCAGLLTLAVMATQPECQVVQHTNFISGQIAISETLDHARSTWSNPCSLAPSYPHSAGSVRLLDLRGHALSLQGQHGHWVPLQAPPTLPVQPCQASRPSRPPPLLPRCPCMQQGPTPLGPCRATPLLMLCSPSWPTVRPCRLAYSGASDGPMPR